MRKLAAVLCAIALILTMAVPALANGSITEVIETGAVEAEVTEELTALEEEGLHLEVIATDTDNYPDSEAGKAVANVVETVNSKEEGVAITVEEIAEKAADPSTALKLAGESRVENGELLVKTSAGKEIKPAEYRFATSFADLVLTDGTEVLYDNNGKAVKATAKVKIPALSGVAKEDLANYLILMIDSTTGDVHFIELNPDDFDEESGEVKVDFPCLGSFALIQKAA